MIRMLEQQEIPAVLTRRGGWQLFRIQALLRAYGTAYDFCRFYLQEESGALLSVLDDSGILEAGADADLAEWADYLLASGIRELSAVGETGALFGQELPLTHSSGAIMAYSGEASSSEKPLQARTMSELERVYRILCSGFEMGDFDRWYCDISHRIRHDTAYLYLLEERGCAFAVSQGDRLFLSGVAVLPEQRGQGTGSRLLRAILSEYVGKTAAVYSRNPNADRFYRRLGFEQIGEWHTFSR